MSEEKIIELQKQVANLQDTLAGVQKFTAMFGDLLIEAEFVTKAKGLSPKTISQNKKLEKFQGIGQRKLLIELKSVAVVKQRKGTRKIAKTLPK